jgi:hypothetical protein
MGSIMNIRHGDVFVLACNCLPEGATVIPRDVRGIVLAYGEVTGHAHRVSAPPGIRVSLWDAAGQRYMTVEGGAALLDHEEHGPVSVPEGTYRINIQRTYDYLSEMERRVAD